MKLISVYKILQTILAIELILFAYGAFLIFNLSPLVLRIFYWTIIPWSIVITVPLWFIVRYKVKSLEVD